MSQNDYDRYVQSRLDQGSKPEEIARGLPGEFPAISLPEAAKALHLVVLAHHKTADRAIRPKALRSFAVVSPSVSPSVATPSQVRDAAYEASLLLQGFPDTSPADMASTIAGTYPTLSLAEMAQVLKYGSPYPVYPTLGATDLGKALLTVDAFHAASRDDMSAALSGVGYSPTDVETALDALYPPPPLTAPEGLALALPGSSKIAASWNAVVTATGYEVQVCDSAGKPLAPQPGVTYDALKALIDASGQAGGAVLNVMARATRKDSSGPWSPAVSITLPLAPLTAPEGLALALQGGSKIAASWNIVATAAAYDVQVCDSAGKPLAPQPGVTYDALKALIDASGQAAGAVLNVMARATRKDSTGPWSPAVSITLPLAPLNAPEGLALALQGGSKIAASWNVVATATAYDVQVCDSAGKPLAPQPGVTYDAFKALIDASAQPAGAVLNVMVRATRKDSTGPWSPAVSITLPLAPLNAPEGLALALQGGSKIAASWKAVATATGYEVQVCDSAGKPLAPQPGVTYDALKALIDASGQAAGAVLNVMVRASRKDLTGPWSPAVSITLPLAPLTAPEGLALALQGGSKVAASWKAVATATGYEVEVCDNAGKPLAPQPPVTYQTLGAVIDASAQPANTILKVLVRARRADSTGPWSPAVSVTLPPPPAHLDHRWAFGEADGTVAFDSAGNVNGTLTAGVTREAQGPLGLRCVHLNGSETAYVSFAGGVGQFATRDFTVALWLRTSEQFRYFDIVGNRTESSHGNFFSLRMQGANPRGRPGSISFELDDNGKNYVAVDTTRTGLNDGQWHHVAVMRQGSTARVYVDAAPSGEKSSGGVTNIANGREFRLGQSVVGMGRFAPNAQYTDLRIYNAALSQDDVKRILTNPVLAVVSGDGQSVPRTGLDIPGGRAVFAPLQVMVRDGLGLPAPGVTVTFAVQSKPAAMGMNIQPMGANPYNATTDSGGLATLNALQGKSVYAYYAEGPVVVSATMAGGFQVLFHLTVTPSPPPPAPEPGATLAILAGNGQTLKASGSRFDAAFAPLRVQLKSKDGKPLSGAQVTWSSPSHPPRMAVQTEPSGASPCIVLTDGSGVAELRKMNAMSVQTYYATGAFTIAATYGAASVTFSLTSAG